MTNEDINKRVAELMGRKVCVCDLHRGQHYHIKGEVSGTMYEKRMGGPGVSLPSPATDLNLAMGLLGDWRAELSRTKESWQVEMWLPEYYTATADTLPRAICLAYLEVNK